MGLQTYRKKRNFSKTPEPRGRTKKSKQGWSFVIQKHAARRLHYDFRLELNGTLKSWAIPKGPSLNPKDKRLAVHVEDHPIEYGGFEGIIPLKQYGGGTVLLWDRGTWEPIGDPVQGYQEGHLKFKLRGEKLHGTWMLARKETTDEEKEDWLLIKERDKEARSGKEADIVSEMPDSVLSGRGIDQIAIDKDRVWQSKSAQKNSNKSLAPAYAPPINLSELKNGKKSALPAILHPQLATLVQRPPAEEGWMHEIKYDGYRILARIKSNKDKTDVELYSRNEKDWTRRFPAIAKSLVSLKVGNAWLDGEIVALRPDGISSFQELQNMLSSNKEETLVYFLFDILFLNGFDLRNLPLIERKKILNELLRKNTLPMNLRYSDHTDAIGNLFYQQACKQSLEGVISKRSDGPYRAGRSKDWLKAKCIRRQEFVIGGFTEPTRSRVGFGALMLGVYEGQGKLRYTGRVGTGFNNELLHDLRQRMNKIEQTDSPFINPPRGAEARGVHWIKPDLVAEINFTEWTEDGSARHPSFQGLREDKSPLTVKREEPAVVEELIEDKEKKITLAAKDKGEAMVAGVKLSNPNRVLFESLNLTKKDLADYYESVADYILPHLKNRPLTLVRCPEGSQSECFYQKHAGETVPKIIDRILIKEDKGTNNYMIANSLAAIIALVQMGVLELHTWGSLADKIEYPDRIILDLDPDHELAWETVVEAAQFVRVRLQSLKLESFLKTTGGKGLHPVIPIARKYQWEEIKEFSKALAEDLVRSIPDLFIATMTKSKRQEKIFVDYLRNTRGATAIAAYSTRAKPAAPISVPISWDELAPKLRSDSYTVKNISQRLRKMKEDPWGGYDQLKQIITKTMKRELGIA
jgi:bifunctional non-homologous end joining protein LigD